MKRVPPATGSYYHVFGRGVDKRTIIKTNADRERFVAGLALFNDRRPVTNFARRELRNEQVFAEAIRKRELLVDIVAYVLMGNHYHLVLRQRVDEGIPLFMQKLLIGYTGYFNLRHERSGVLFDGKYKHQHVTEDRYLRHLVAYVHLNPLDQYEPAWRTGGVTGRGHISKAIQFLADYPWSSYPAYRFDFDEEHVPLLYRAPLNKALIEDLGLPRGKEHQRVLEDWISRAEKHAARLGGVFEEGGIFDDR